MAGQRVGGAVHDAAAYDAAAPLETGHWAYDALDRLAAAGVLGAHAPGGMRPLPLAVVADALRVAAEAEAARPVLATFARNALRRLRAEFPGAVAAGDGPDGPGGAGAVDGPGGDEGPLRAAGVAASAFAGFVGGDGRRGAVLEPRLVWAPAAGIALHYSPRFEYGAAPGSSADAAVSHDRFGISARWRALWLFAGRERIDFGLGSGGGIVLSDRVAFDGFGIATHDAVELPWLGPTRAALYLSRIGGDALGERAGFAAMRLSFSPAPWVQLHLSRTMLVARSRGADTISAGDVLLLLVGKHTPFEDQRASVGIRLRAAVGGWPIEPYIEWGFEDTAGLHEDPGIVAGLYAPVVPGAPGLALRYEYAAFGRAARWIPLCCFERRNWYRHGGVRARYADADGTPIGHPLGGYGLEHRAEARLWLDDARLHLRAAAFLRRRREGNILAAVRPGTSSGAAVDAGYALGGRWIVEGSLWIEAGRDGWSDEAGRLGVRAVF